MFPQSIYNCFQFFLKLKTDIVSGDFDAWFFLISRATFPQLDARKYNEIAFVLLTSKILRMRTSPVFYVQSLKGGR